jgi:hypothetical protein
MGLMSENLRLFIPMRATRARHTSNVNIAFLFAVIPGPSERSLQFPFPTRFPAKPHHRSVYVSGRRYDKLKYMLLAVMHNVSR